MDAMEVIFTRRSIRKYTGEAVTEAQLEKILEAAMNAPSANNRQPWHFVVVTERDKLNTITEIHPFTQMLKQAPMAIIVCGDTSISQSYWVQDCSAATQNILLAARAQGLGTVWCGIYPKEPRVTGLSQLLNLPANIKPLCVIAVGHPAEQKGRVERFKPERIHREGW